MRYLLSTTTFSCSRRPEKFKKLQELVSTGTLIRVVMRVSAMEADLSVAAGFAATGFAAARCSAVDALNLLICI